MFEQTRGLVAGACSYCAAVYGVKDAIEETEVELLDEFAGHPSVRKLMSQGYQILTLWLLEKGWGRRRSSALQKRSWLGFLFGSAKARGCADATSSVRNTIARIESGLMPIARLLFALLILAMAIGQLLSFSAFVEAIAGYQLAGETLSRILSVALVVGELFAGIGLLTGGPRFRHLAGSVGFGVAVTWSALAVQAFLRGLDVANCGCFGRYLAQRLSWFVLLQDAYFLILAYLAMRSAFRDRVVDLQADQAVGPRSDGR